MRSETEGACHREGVVQRGHRGGRKRARVAGCATICERSRKWGLEGNVGLVSKKERVEESVLGIRAQMESSLPDDVAELKRIAARLMTERAMLERELEHGPLGHQLGKPPNETRVLAASELKDGPPLVPLLEVLGISPSSTTVQWRRPAGRTSKPMTSCARTSPCLPQGRRSHPSRAASSGMP